MPVPSSLRETDSVPLTVPVQPSLSISPSTHLMSCGTFPHASLFYFSSWVKIALYHCSSQSLAFRARKKAAEVGQFRIWGKPLFISLKLDTFLLAWKLHCRAGPWITSSCAMSFHCNVHEMPYVLNSYLYSLASAKIGFLMSFRHSSKNLSIMLRKDLLGRCLFLFGFVFLLF